MFGLFFWIASLKSPTVSPASMSTGNAFPSTPASAQKSFTIFPRGGGFWNEEVGRRESPLGSGESTRFLRVD
ncbi:hypothetical protein PF005_g23079 [Phytophthora fragariae]|uniref:RxLR effector protein n=1 Tax=Phytophthora fragariae TaxID=53985 RepID=A0A6A3WJ81_9STRA|nr:hypothetical protein PF005_g23079 [Phytophthora fragariae]KAE9284422.1 hypothetical protein PF001_g22393 [Phytophthora fragariae]